MLKLFDDNDRYTPKGLEVDREMCTALGAIIDSWAAEGYSVRELSAIAHAAVQDITCITILTNAMKEKENNEKRKLY